MKRCDLLPCLLMSLLLFLGIAPVQAASEPGIRSPKNNWVVDFDDAQCVASRDYGSDSEPLVLVLKAPAIGAVVQVAVIRNGRGGRYAEQLDATIGVDGREIKRTGMIAAMTSQKGRRLYRINLPTVHLDALRGAKTISITGGREFSETFAVTLIVPLLNVMTDCVADLRKVWNIGEGGALPPNLREQAQGSVSGIFKASDYPDAAIDRKGEGTVKVVMLVDETGKVVDCTVTQTSGVAVLDAQSCGIISARARFKPAIGLDGRPAKTGLQQSITWRMQ